MTDDPGREQGTDPFEADPFEADLRRLVHRRAGSPGAEPWVDADAVLGRVHRGARRRRARRTVGAGLAVLAVVATATATLPALLDGTEAPVADPALRVGAVEVVGDTVWATTAGTCADGPCAALARSADGGETWTLNRTDQATQDALPAAAAGLSLAASGDDGWAWRDGAVVATHDGGRSWADVAVPGGEVVGIAAGEQRAVAVTGGGTTLSVADVGGGAFTRVDGRLEPGEQLAQPFATADTLGALVLGDRGEAAGLVVDTGAGLVRDDFPECDPSELALVDAAGGTVWTACLGAERTDVNAAGDRTSLEAGLISIDGPPQLLARPDGSALLAGMDEGFQLEEVGEPVRDPAFASTLPDLVPDAEGFVDSDAGDADWLVTGSGTLLTDGSGGWEPVAVE